MEKQPFENHKRLTDSIEFGANNWQIQGAASWTEHLSAINEVCDSNRKLRKKLKQAGNVLSYDMFHKLKIEQTLKETEV